MAEDRLKTWETLKYRHRFSKDIDIFVPDPQYLGHVTPRLNDTAESMTGDYVEQGNFVKLLFPEGEIDFIASAALTATPTTTQTLLDREVRVETATEIIAKKLWHRGTAFTARDIFDLALVAEREPKALKEIEPVLRDRRDAVLARISDSDKQLRDAFGKLEILEYQRDYDECVAIVRKVLERA